MVITVFGKDEKILKTIGRVKGFLCFSNKDLLITFEDFSEMKIKEEEYSYFYVNE